ncbi:MAG: Flp pilus assembly complex ATPase component TadA [Candidatus Omnitrophica bacterium]|nr:Flp pilus assembly complex ATPase component TadA [Candidatus Omnitrophota bacterium]MCB9748249.1 Flp pilus assembly complex ATPase component TadA [Candidatus Omnitrophota bacterium]
MAHIKLGEILVEQGLITKEQLENAIKVQKLEKGRIGEILIKQGFVTEEDMSAALGSQLGIPYYSSENSSLLTPKEDQNLEKIITSQFAKKNIVLPLSKNLNSLTCAVYDPLDLIVIDNLRRVTGCEINLVIATKTAIIKAINEFYFQDSQGDGKNTLLDAAVEDSYTQNDDDEISHAPKTDASTSAELSLDKLIEKAGEAPVIKLVDLIIRQAIDERASDIHIEPFENKIHLRYRIDGNLYNIPPPAPHLHLPIVSRIKILSKLDIAEKRLPQDGAISAKLEDRTVDIRISTVPTVWGEKVVMRILDKSAVPLQLSNLGFDTKQIDALRKALASPYGLFFVTGPTGSGKSTTLYSALSETMDPRKNILTIEDPVEFKLEGVNQVSVKNEIGLTFATALKAFLRQDPDVIMVGEVRDLETASICVRAALTGHFVLSTLHTNDAASAVNRLIDIGIPNYLLTPSLIMILAQRLARKLCPHCKEPYEPTKEQHGGIEFKSDLIYKAKGCEKCNNTGYRGRLVVAEVLSITDNIRALLSKNASYSEIKDAARKNGMSTIFESGLRLVEQGLTSFDEVCRVSVDIN